MPPSRRPHPPRAFHSVKVTPPIPRLPPRQHRTHSSRHSGFAAARPRVVDERCYIIRRGGGSEYVSRASVPLSDFEAEGCAARGGQPVLSPLSHRSTSRSRLGGAARVAACATRPRPPFPHHQSGLRRNRVGGVKPNSSCRLRGYIPSTPALQAGADASPAQHCTLASAHERKGWLWGQGPKLRQKRKARRGRGSRNFI